MKELESGHMYALQQLDGEAEQNEHTHLARLNIEGAIFELETRAAERAGRDTDFSIHKAVYGTTCSKCGHIQCKGDCHA